MVADKVELLTRKAGESEATRWESSGEGTYTIETVDDAPQGTSVTLHLKPEDAEDELHDYTAEWKITEPRQEVLRLHLLADPDGGRAAHPARRGGGEEPSPSRPRPSTR